jgi:hypothetical protein
LGALRAPGRTDGARSPEALAATAFHEAGHAAVGDRLGLRLQAIDVDTDTAGGLGHTTFEPAGHWFDADRGVSPEDPTGARHREFVDRIVTTLLAGLAAESRYTGQDRREGAGFDLLEAVRDWVAISYSSPEERRAAMRKLHARAGRLIQLPEIWAAVERLANGLLERRRLSGEEALALLAHPASPAPRQG